MDKEKDILLDHDYDGIQELDNDLPPWWLWLFYATIVFAGIYFFWFHVAGFGDDQATRYLKEMDPTWTPPPAYSSGLLPEYKSPYYAPAEKVSPYLEAQFAAYIGPNVPVEALIIEAMRRSGKEELELLKTTYPDLFAQMETYTGPKVAAAGMAAALTDVELLTDETSMAAGFDIFKVNCASCHGNEGQGLIGPNLTDDFWIHGPKIDNIANTIYNGVPAKGMIAWRGVLSNDQIQQVSSYVMSLHGNTPLNPKAPEGQKYEYPLN